MPAQLVTHAVLHCDYGTSDKIWAGLVVQQPGQPAQAITYYAARNAALNESAKDFPTTPQALAYFDRKMQEKLERHNYVRCDWRRHYYGVQHGLPQAAPVGADDELARLRRWGPDLAHGGDTPVRGRSFLSLPRPDTDAAYAPGVYTVDQEPAWVYVVPEAVPYGYALAPNAMLVGRYAADLFPTWVWRARRTSPAFLEPATHLSAPDAADLVERVAGELMAYALGM